MFQGSQFVKLPEFQGTLAECLANSTSSCQPSWVTNQALQSSTLRHILASWKTKNSLQWWIPFLQANRFPTNLPEESALSHHRDGWIWINVSTCNLTFLGTEIWQTLKESKPASHNRPVRHGGFGTYKSQLKQFVLCSSRMRSKGSRFTLGVWGLRVCSLDAAFTSATVRNRSQLFASGPYGRAYGKFCKRGHFWMFPASRSCVSRGRRGTSWHSDVFRKMSKIVLCGRRNTFATFSDDAFRFSWQPQHFGRAHRHFAWQAQHFRRVLLLVFCESHCQGCVKWRQGANSVAGLAFCEVWWKLTELSHET